MEKLRQLKVLKFTRDDNAKPLQVVVTDKVIKRGRFGEVRVGYNKENKVQAYAVKIIDKSRLQNKKAQHDLQNEIELLTVLQSPNINMMKAVTKENEDYYLAMEMCNGGDLSDLLNAKGGFLTEADARQIIIQIIKGIACMHERDIMHRNLKPDNILVHFPNLSYKELFDKRFNLEEYVSKVNLNSGF